MNSRLSDIGLKEFVCTESASIERVLHVPADGIHLPGSFDLVRIVLCS
jgi:hypothetical protein